MAKPATLPDCALEAENRRLTAWLHPKAHAGEGQGLYNGLANRRQFRSYRSRCPLPKGDRITPCHPWLIPLFLLFPLKT